MPTDKTYLNYIAEQLSALPDVSIRPMMGEYILYFGGKIVGGLYDDRFLVKPTPAALRMMPDAPREIPYPGAKEMLLVEETDDRAFLCTLLCAMDADLPAPKKKK